MAKPKLCLIPAAQGSKFYSVLPSDGVGDFTFTRGSSATRINAQGLIETVADTSSRLNYDLLNGKVVNCPHYLLEPARTNLLTYSEQIQNTSNWNQLGGDLVVTGNAVISPDGTLNAGAITLANSSNRYFVHSYITQTAGVTYTFSVYMKSAIGNLSIGLGGINGLQAVNKTVTTEWQRFTYTFTAAATSIEYYGIDQRGLDKSTSGTLYFWGAQVEEGSYATSYIPTSGSTVTRAAETCNNSGNSEVFNDSEGVLFGNISALVAGGGSRYLSISDGSFSNRVSIFFDPSPNTIAGRIAVGGASTFLNATGQTQTNYNKIALKWKVNDYKLYINGFEVGEYLLGGTFPESTLSEISFNDAIGSPFYGKTKEVGCYDTALTDIELETLTSYRNWVSMVNELNLNIIYNG